jgi:hypothetical protein
MELPDFVHFGRATCCDWSKPADASGGWQMGDMLAAPLLNV